MWNSRAGKLFIAAALLVVLIGIALRFANKEQQQSSNSPTALNEIAERRQLSTSTRMAAQETPAEAKDQQEDANPLKLPPQKIEEYLKLHHRDAASLLAAFHASSDGVNPTNGFDYLKEAATNFPNEPHVQLTVLARDAFPEERRKWLDAFKESSPSNSLANYLSAREHFKNNQPDAAINELLTASGKPQFADFAMESYLGADELARFSGKPPLIANTMAMAAVAGDLLPGLANFKGIATGVAEVQKQYQDAGDTASVANLGQMGVGLAGRLTSGDGGRFVISHLVGIATENIVLKSLDQNSSYDFLGGKTPAQRLEELKQQKQAFRDLTQSFIANFAQMTESERDGYTERMKIYGEVEAIRWLQQRHGAKAP